MMDEEVLMKENYVSPELEQILLRQEETLAVINEDFELGGGRGDHTSVSNGDIDIELLELEQ